MLTLPASVTAIVAASFSSLHPNLRPFSLTDPSISFPFQKHAKISTGVLAVISTIIPGVIIIVVTFCRPSLRKKGLKTQLWHLNMSMLGLGLALAFAMLVTDGMKNLVGKPRPDLLSRCDPDPRKLQSGQYYASTSGHLVWAEVCRSYSGKSQNGLDAGELFDGFRSWVSGHSSRKLTSHICFNYSNHLYNVTVF